LAKNGKQSHSDLHLLSEKFGFLSSTKGESSMDTRRQAVRTIAGAFVGLGLCALVIACGYNEEMDLVDHNSGLSGSAGTAGTAGAAGTSGGAGIAGTTNAGATGGSAGSSGQAGSSGTGGTTSTGGAAGAGGTTNTGGSSGTGGATGTGGTSGVGGNTVTGGSAGTGGQTDAGNGDGATPQCQSGETQDCVINGQVGKKGCQTDGTWSPCIRNLACVIPVPAPCAIGVYGCFGTVTPGIDYCDMPGTKPVVTLVCQCPNPATGLGTWLPGGVDCDSMTTLCWK